jgi:hypothetical protein
MSFSQILSGDEKSRQRKFLGHELWTGEGSLPGVEAARGWLGMALRGIPTPAKYRSLLIWEGTRVIPVVRYSYSWLVCQRIEEVVQCSSPTTRDMV